VAVTPPRGRDVGFFTSAFTINPVPGKDRSLAKTEEFDAADVREAKGLLDELPPWHTAAGPFKKVAFRNGFPVLRDLFKYG
jgi:hypothetical protein